MRALGQYQINELLLWERPGSCSLLCFTRIGSVSGGRLVSLGVPKLLIHDHGPARPSVEIQIHTPAVDACVVVKQASTAADGSSAAKQDMAGCINRRTLVLCITTRSGSDPGSREGRYPLKLSDTPYTKIVKMVRIL